MPSLDCFSKSVAILALGGLLSWGIYQLMFSVLDDFVESRISSFAKRQSAFITREIDWKIESHKDADHRHKGAK